jgi:endonuclease/exonuclease/phosphatase family metal-dependent hydrolase
VSHPLYSQKLLRSNLRLQQTNPNNTGMSEEGTEKQINVNECSLQELQSLEGIGPVLAERIIAGRPYNNAHQMTTVKGLGKERMKEILPHLTGFKPKSYTDNSALHGKQGLDNEQQADERLKKSEFLLASWNIRNISKSKSEEKLQKILDIFTRFDLVAVQEVRDVEVLETMLKLLGNNWSYRVSGQVGTAKHKERYAFFWRTSAVQLISEPALLNEETKDYFVREPFIGYFRAGVFDFVLATVHIVWGDSIAGRREEIKQLDKVLLAISDAAKSEKDIILCGDFNMPPSDLSWSVDGWQNLIDEPARTVVGDTSLYDNVSTIQI